jgi:IMP dehydrogenase
MRSVRDLDLIVVRLEPWASAEDSARQLAAAMAGHGAVVVEGALLGTVSRAALEAVPGQTPVRELVKPPRLEVDESMPVRRLATLFMETGADVASVNRGDAFVGLVSPTLLLGEIGRSWDPLTGLSWGDRLRDWGVRALEAGREITLLFFDLDDFGAYNKRHGHIVGDRVIKAVARTLSEHVRPETDVLVRYAGDEFVLASLRPREEIEGLSDRLSGIAVAVEGVTEDVRFTVGVSGGKRTRERDRDHYASTVDNLINLASKDSLARKRRSAGGAAATARANGEHVTYVSVEEGDPATAAVAVQFDGREGTGVYSLTQASALEAVVHATARAVERALPGLTVAPGDAWVYRRADGSVSLSFRGKVTEGGTETVIQATHPVTSDLYEAAAEAVCRAVAERTAAGLA